MAKNGKGTNLDKLRQVVEASKANENDNFSWFKPNWGDNLVRILPAISDDDVFFLETAEHNLGQDRYYCLQYKIDPATGKAMKCPICEARTKLFRSGDKAKIKIAKDIKAKKKYLMNLVDRKSEDPSKIFVYGAGVKVWGKMVSEMLDEDIDITDVEDGYDFVIKKEEGPKNEQGQFPVYDNSKAKRTSSPLHRDKDVVKTILEKRINLNNIPRYEDAEDLTSAVNAFIKSLTEAPSNEEFYEDEGSEKESTQTKATPEKKSDISSFKDKLKKQLSADDDEDEDE